MNTNQISYKIYLHIKMVKQNKKQMTEESRDVTINLLTRVHKIAFKKKAKRAVSEIRKFAAKQMKTDDVRVDTRLNQFVWSNGIRYVPRKVRVRMTRRKNEDEEAKSKFYTLVEHVPVESFDGLLSEVSKLRQ